MTNAEKLASVGGGGTNCSAPMQLLNSRRQKADVVVYISDYESWVDGAGYGRGTGLMTEWTRFKDHNPKAKLVCIDLTPRANHQVKEHEDILQVGGFSDAVFDVIAKFVEGGWNKNFWVDTIQKIPLGE
jgi:60 kDa SS-A/Ro ribonucleoprotein